MLFFQDQTSINVVFHLLHGENCRCFEESMRNVFALNWISSDCNECNNTGGRCGFDLG